MSKLLRLIFALTLLPLAVLAQNGKISGTTTNKDTKEPVPFAVIKVKAGGQVKGGGQSDINGFYTTGPLVPGTYDVEVLVNGFKPKTITGVVVNFETTTRLELPLIESTKTTDEVEVVYKRPIVTKDETSTGGKLTSKDIEKLPTRSVNAILNTVAGVYSADVNDGLNIRGNREGDNAVFINGVRQFGGGAASVLPPPEAIQEVSVITGGVPAQYGDVLGGIVSITTKSATEKFYGNVTYETSRPFDRYNYDLYSLQLAGPLLKAGGTYDEATGVMSRRRTLLGFFTNFQYQGEADASPSAYGYYRASNDKLSEIQTRPLVLKGSTVQHRANFFTKDSLQWQSFRPNAQRHQFNFNSNFDFAPTENILISFGGNVNYFQTRGGGDFNLYNFDNNSINTAFAYNGFVRFLQRFQSEKDATVKNIYYQLQVDLSQSWNYNEDPTHRGNLARYDHTGYFVPVYANSFNPTTITEVTAVNGVQLGNPRPFNPIPGQSIFLDQLVGTAYLPSSYNTWMANQNVQAYNLIGTSLGGLSLDAINTGAFNQFQIGVNGVGIPNTAYSYGNFAGGGGAFPLQGQSLSAYNRGNSDQARISGQVSMDVGRHSIKAGFEFEQRLVVGWGSSNPLTRGRNLLNRQFFELSERAALDSINAGQFTYYRINRAIRRDENTGAIVNQSDFDRNMRIALGLNPNGNDFINIDQLNPDQITLDKFSVADLLDNGFNPITNWQGYDAYGNRTQYLFTTQRTSFNDFFFNTNAPIDAFRPLYYAGFIEDKFEWKDLIVRVGLRIDAFDINSQVLRDNYSLTKLLSVGEIGRGSFTQFNNGGRPFSLPNNVGDDFNVYVNRDAASFSGLSNPNYNQFTVVGFRSGSTWYDANGNETQNSRQFLQGGSIFPMYDLSNLSARERTLWERSRVTTTAFESFRPQVNVMPRVAFSFPISEEATFFAHYDVLTQRPLTTGGGSNFATPLNYMALFQVGNTVNGGGLIGQYIPNTALRPQTKIDYQVGFQQALNNNMALKFSGSYSEIRDLIALITVPQAFPLTYTTDGNIDFSTVQNYTAEYIAQDLGHLNINASYTLQFAETSASGFAQSILAQTATPTLRQTIPAAFDSRHAFKLTLDYRYKKNEGPLIFGKRLLQNAGVNLVNVATAGTPYTRLVPEFTGNVLEGNLNANRLPWNIQTSVRFDKTFIFKGIGSERPNALNVYIYVQNLFDVRNVLGAYGRTGSATDDGYLTSSFGQQQLSSAVDGGLSRQTFIDYYNLTILNPALVSLPRWVRVGVSYSF